MVRNAFLIILLLLAVSLFGQEEAKRIEILNANSLRYDDALAPGAQRLVGAVRLRHETAIMRCDSAWLYEDQTMKAFGRVHLVQGDTLDIKGDQLNYNGSERKAELVGDVVLNDPQLTLRTDRLDYDLDGKTAYYTSGGRIVSKKEKNTLTSKRGQYNTAFKEFIFSDSVLLVHPDRIIRSDTLKYRSKSGRALFAGPTEIEQGNTRILCTNGWYDTRTDRSELNEGARILFKDQELTGDTVRYDRNSGTGKAWGNVVMVDTTNDLTVKGEHGVYSELTDESFVTGEAVMEMVFSEDTLFLHGDTLLSVNDSLGNRVLHAYYGVRYFRTDMQGVCDSLVYSISDSTIHFWKAPLLWNEEEQLSGDSIWMLMSNGKPHRLFIRGKAFMMSKVDSIKFDQISGTDMTGFFRDNELQTILATGNCRTVYFAVEEEEGERKIIGVNRADCSKLRVRVKERSVNRITFITQPLATMYPLKKAPQDELILEGADWQEEQRPVDRNDIFRVVMRQ